MSPRPICIAIHALGGQGGGVLVDWIVSMAEAEGWLAQSTSVAGVAQRTGATIYYIELVAPANLRQDGWAPVLAQMPVPGEVDILVAAELMEAGRAVNNGFVTRDRTVVIASSHRAYSVLEKSVPGNGIADAQGVIDQVTAEARQIICEDFQSLAAPCLSRKRPTKRPSGVPALGSRQAFGPFGRRPIARAASIPHPLP
jgi:indolepyruvate ferredoxin oxidoreductase beta subunit